MIETIKLYEKAGLKCLPCRKDKAPLLPGTWNREFELKEFEGVEAIGIKTGKASDGLICMDFDNHFNDAKEILKSFLEIHEVKEIYDKYKLPIQSTQSGGYHLLFRTDNPEGNLKLARRPKKVDNRYVPDTIIETRGEGGYFCANPTNGYQIIRNDILDIQKITDQEKIIFYNSAKSFNEWHEVRNTEFESGEKPGDIYNNSIEAYDKTRSILINSGWKEIKENQFTRPGKDKGVSATFNKAAKNVFYVFSSNGYPFESEKGYSPFQVKALLEYNGDFSACAKDLGEKYKPSENKKKDVIPQDKLKEILGKCFIDIEKTIDKPPVILYILENDLKNREKRVFTLGNFSAIIGKAKSKKTFFLGMITASLIKNGIIENKFRGQLPENKRRIILFDTEQGDYDAFNSAKRITAISGCNVDYFGAFSLREFNYKERCEIIEYALKTIPGVGFVVIDGIADLAYGINDEEEATRVTGLLLRWTKQYNCHIATVIHQNKNDNFATGHLGSSIMKKCEMIISVTKDKKDKYSSIVDCEMGRGIDFEKFAFSINDKGLPFVNENIECNEEKLDF